MTVSVQIPEVSYQENGLTDTFPVPFRYLDPSDLRAMRRSSDGSETVLAFGADFSATDGNSNAGGELTLTSTVSDARLLIWRETAPKQEADYLETGPFPAESHEQALDRSALIDQEKALQLARTPMVPRGEEAFEFASMANQPDGSLFQLQANKVVPISKLDLVNDIKAEVETHANAILDQAYLFADAVRVDTFEQGLAATAAGGAFVIYDRVSGQARLYVNGQSMDLEDWLHAIQGVVPNPVSQVLTPGTPWQGAAGEGYTVVPSDPVRTTAKPMLRQLTVPRQTITGELVIGVAAMANNNGSIYENCGLSHVNCYCEGNVIQVAAPSFRTFTRHDGMPYLVLGWWVTLQKPEGKEGLADVYWEAVPTDSAMRNRVIGPHRYLMYDDEFDFDVTVGAAGATYTSMSAAWNAIRTGGYDRPRITVIDGAIEDMGAAIGQTLPEGFTRIEASVPVEFKQAPPAQEGDVTYMQTRVGRMHFKGPNISIDMVQTIQIRTETQDAQHWFDGCTIRNSAGREQLWRKFTRHNILPALIEDGAYLTDCLITDVNDCGDKTPLARGNILRQTWGDAFQDARCAIANDIEDHSSFAYYQNIDALSLQYSGSAATASVSLSGGNSTNGRVFTLKEDGTAVDTFTLQNTEAAFVADTNYTVQNLVDWINTQVGWSATVIDDTRLAAALTFPGSTNGGSFTDLDAKTAVLTLPTHFDVHSDLYQLPNLGAVRENIVFGYNLGWRIDAQNKLITGNNELHDAFFIGNAIYNNEGTPDAALATQLDHIQSHVVFAHNTMPTQRLLLRQDADYDGGPRCLVCNNVLKELTVSGGGAIDVDVAVNDNHLLAGATDPSGAVGTTIGGTVVSLFADAPNGNFAPAGELLTNTAVPRLRYGQRGVAFANPGPKGAVA